MKYWARFRATLAKYGYRHYRYFWVKEFTKKGKLHLHIAISVYVPIWLIRHAWYYATEKTSWVVYITSRINNPAGYMMKYATKSIDSKFRYRERRYGFSRIGFSPKKYVPDGKWTYRYDTHLTAEMLHIVAAFMYRRRFVKFAGDMQRKEHWRRSYGTPPGRAPMDKDAVLSNWGI